MIFIKELICTYLVLTLCTDINCVTASKDYMELTARNIGQTLAQCLGTTQKIECLEGKVMDTLEKVLHDNSTWQYSDYLLFERNSAGLKNIWDNNTQRSISDRIGDRLLQLAQSRSLRLKLPPITELMNLQAGISNAVDDFAATTADAAPQGDEGMQRILNGLGVDDKIAQIYAGRKKKDKDKHMAMMGGMTIVAMLAQMFLGKVILIAGAAFVMAKIALLISIIGSLKKGHGSGGGGGTEHVIVTGGGGGGGGGGGHHSHESSGWHRSMPYEYTKIQEITSSDDHDDIADVHDEPHTSTYETTDAGGNGWTAGWHRRMSSDHGSQSSNVQTELDSGGKIDATRSQHINKYINHRLTETGEQLGSQNITP